MIAGGFAHGDYLRPGAIARFSPVMDAVGEAAADGMPVIGICNGFQVLTEAGLLPGALQKNAGLSFLCTEVTLRVETIAQRRSRSGVAVGTELRIPINHFEGNYTVDPETLPGSKDNDQIVAALRRQPQRLGRLHRRRVQRRRQRGRPHAAPRARQRLLLGSADGLSLLRGLLAGV